MGKVDRKPLLSRGLEPSANVRSDIRRARILSRDMSNRQRCIQTLVKSFEAADLPARCSKFVARKQWVIIGSDDMFIRVYNYNTMDKVKTFEAHTDYIRSIAVHPTLPYVLSASDDMLIKLWDWDKGWTCTQVFEGHSHYVMQVRILRTSPCALTYRYVGNIEHIRVNLEVQVVQPQDPSCLPGDRKSSPKAHTRCRWYSTRRTPTRLPRHRWTARSRCGVSASPRPTTRWRGTRRASTAWTTILGVTAPTSSPVRPHT